MRQLLTFLLSLFIVVPSPVFAENSAQYEAFQDKLYTYLQNVLNVSNEPKNVEIGDNTTVDVSDNTSINSPQISLNNPQISSFVEMAMSYEGVPYVWGGNAFAYDGTDCSGLIYGALKQTIDPSVSDKTATGLMNTTIPITVEELQYGDLIYFSYSGDYSNADHVAIYAGVDEEGFDIMFHAIQPFVKFSRLDDVMSYGGTWRSYVIGYGRIPIEG